MTTKENSQLDADAILRIAGNARVALESVLTPDELTLEVSTTDDAMPSLAYAADERDVALRDFDTLAVADSLTALGQEIKAYCARRTEELYRRSLEVYYVAEELSRDPSQAELRAHVEAIRRAHEQQYGKPIPPRASK